MVLTALLAISQAGVAEGLQGQRSKQTIIEAIFEACGGRKGGFIDIRALGGRQTFQIWGILLLLLRIAACAMHNVGATILHNKRIIIS